MRTPVLPRCAARASALSITAILLATQVPAQAQPLAFVPNHGQWDARVLFRSEAGPMSLWLTAQGWTLAVEHLDGPRPSPGTARDKLPGRTLRGVALQMTFEGAGPVFPRGEGRVPGVRNYFAGHDAHRWITGVPAHACVRYPDLYPGVDLVVREQDGHFEYDLHVAPGANLGQVAVRCEGHDALRVAEDGALVLETALGAVRQTPPIAWQVQRDGQRVPIVSRFTVLAGDRFGFAVPDRRPDLPLVIDPGLLWSRYLGSSGEERTAEFGDSGVLADNGDVLLCGKVISTTFPTTPGAYQRAYGGAPVGAGWGDGFVTRIAPGGSLVWSTYLGTSGQEIALGVAPIEGTDDVLVTGWTDSPSFPTTAGAYDTTHNGGKDAFVARLDWDRAQQKQTLAWCTFVGAAGDDRGKVVAMQPTGEVAVLGGTDSPEFPTTPSAFDTSYNGVRDCAVFVLDGSGRQLLFSTFAGGSDADRGLRMVADAAGGLVFTGDTQSPDYPTTPNAYDTSHNGGKDAYVCRLDATLTTLTWSTFLGGDSWEYGWSVALGPTGEVCVTGSTFSYGFPVTTGAFQASYAGTGPLGYGDGFVTCLDPGQSGSAQLVWSTYLGTDGDEALEGVAVERSGIVTVTGGTGSVAFPTTPGAYDRSHNGGWDACVTRLDPSKTGSSQLVYSSYFGGSANEWATDVELDGLGGAVLSGLTWSPNLPVAGSYGGQEDVFVAHLDMLPTGVERYGPSTPACAWPLYAGVNSWPQRGNTSFRVLGTGAAPSAAGALFLGVRTPPIPVLNLQLLQGPLAVVPAGTTGLGFIEMRLPLSAGLPVGAKLALQWLFVTSASCPGTGVLSSSNGIELTIQ